MAEYIERESLIEVLRKSHSYHARTSRDSSLLGRDIRLVKEQPAADVVEVVHGEWIWNEDCECWVCSVCELSALNNYRGLSVNSEYCPHCGKKMDGGNRNDDA